MIESTRAPVVAVVDHGMGNLRSVVKALEAAGARPRVTQEVAGLQDADALCVPGQGIFGRCMTALARGLGDAISEWVRADRPYLGICLGMQILFTGSEEGAEPGLDVVPGRVTRLPDKVAVPHMGWNTVSGRHYYFDHSYAAHPDDDSAVTGWCDHGERFAARIDKGRLTAVQFHPEKSGRAGLALLREWVGSL